LRQPLTVFTATSTAFKATADMPSKLMYFYVAFDILFALCGGLIIGFSLMSEQEKRRSPTIQNVAHNLLLDQCPLTGTATLDVMAWSHANLLHCGDLSPMEQNDLND
jgi:hypothetical protein